jgi:hypothetical protein
VTEITIFEENKCVSLFLATPIRIHAHRTSNHSHYTGTQCLTVSLSIYQPVYHSVSKLAEKPSGERLTSTTTTTKNTYTFPHINQTEFSAYQTETTAAISGSH